MDLDDLKRLIDAFEASDWDEVTLELDGTVVHLSTAAGGANGTFAARDAANVPFAPSPAPEPGQERAAEPPIETGEPVRATSPGIFWHAPAPGQPPFVSIGDTVSPDSVIGIVELMKLMNRVTADVSGVVTAICVGNGETVEKGAVLVRVETG